MIEGIIVSIYIFNSKIQRFDLRLSRCPDLHRPLPLPIPSRAAGWRTLPAFSLPGTFRPAQRLIGDVYNPLKRNN